ncbi:helix-turn-helix transcriptional regulator [Candidatus Colwellia aromaticivorans]|uniref:helix-turn-helix transcriptional regulator n=1 Tax=Candidatus Colwellia aromaticivorans TaxID=2267621 RepID=UPI000DF41BFD|nr:hypothetical protein [Candidatus Colwellia aromaticivorans]
MDFDKYNDVIESIYQASIDAHQWDTALQDVSDYFHSEGAGLFSQNPYTQEVNSIAFLGLKEGYLESYGEYYGHINPTFIDHSELRSGVMFTEQVFNQRRKNEDFYKNSTFSNEWMNPQGFSHAAGGMLIADGKNTLHFTLIRSSQQGLYTQQELKVLGAFSKHICKAVQLSKVFQRTNYRMKNAEQLLANMGHGILIIDGDQNVLESNQIALNSIEKNPILAIQQGKLISHHLGFKKQLCIELQQTMVNSMLKKELPIRLNLPEYENVLLILMPVMPELQSQFDRPAALLIIKESTAINPLNMNYLQKSYNLNPSETRLTKYLAEGYELKRAAYEMGVSYETARWYLKSIFEKTGTHRQIDLILKINVDPVARHAQ